LHRLDVFEHHEIVDLDSISNQLVGSSRRHDLVPIMYNELRHRVALKLSLGERAVVPITGLTTDQRRQLVALASNQGAYVYMLGTRPESGTIHIRAYATMQPILPLPVDLYAHLRAKRFAGITIIGDVHGELDALQQALDWARSRQHFVWLLGDIVDYGKHALEVVEVVHHAVMHGEASMVLANHERKIARYLDRAHNVRISDGNKVTIDALEALTDRERGQWTGRFRALLSHAALIQQISSISIMHAAAHPSLWSSNPESAAIEQYALYGESDQSSGRFHRTHRWVDMVPADRMVIVGHDIISQFPLVMTGTLGGKVVFLDTGSGKGGKLSTADLRFHEDTLTLECFKQY